MTLWSCYMYISIYLTKIYMYGGPCTTLAKGAHGRSHTKRIILVTHESIEEGAFPSVVAAKYTDEDVSVLQLLHRLVQVTNIHRNEPTQPMQPLNGSLQVRVGIIKLNRMQHYF